jgi:hypothetical protein
MSLETDLEEDDEYFPEYVDDAELTGKEPKFFKLPTLETEPDKLAAMKVDDLIKMYRAERDQLATDRKGWKAREARVKLHLDTISMLLSDRAQIVGTDSFVTQFGTAFKDVKRFFKIADWAKFSQWLLRTGNVHVVQKRLSPNAVKEIVEEQMQVMPPDQRSTAWVVALPEGVESWTEEKFAVRSPTARKYK